MTKSKMLAFHGDPKIKSFYLARVRAHREADELIHGIYWEEGKGCAVGCTVHSSSHAAYEAELGIPRALALIEDGIFESLKNGESKLWPENFLSAIHVGADLSGVKDKFLYWLLVDPSDGVIKFAKRDRSKQAIQSVADLYQKKLAGETVTSKQWQDAAAADAAAADAYAYAAYAYAAYAADTADAYAYAAYSYAAYAAADAAAADAYAYAAYSYAAYDYDYAAAAARAAARKRQAEKLIELLQEAKPTVNNPTKDK